MLFLSHSANSTIDAAPKTKKRVRRQRANDDDDEVVVVGASSTCTLPRGADVVAEVPPKTKVKTKGSSRRGRSSTSRKHKSKEIIQDGDSDVEPVLVPARAAKKTAPTVVEDSDSVAELPKKPAKPKPRHKSATESASEDEDKEKTPVKKPDTSKRVGA